MLHHRTDTYIGRSLAAYGEFSQMELDLLGQILHPAQTVVDAGANIGTHTIAFARMVGPLGLVYAFEPQVVIFQTLCANLRLNGIHHVYAYHAALGCTCGLGAMPAPDYNQPNNFGGISLDASADGETISVLTIDHLRLKYCHLIKVDVEGMESEVIAGAAQTIRRFRPVLYVENDREPKSPILIGQIQRLGYRIWSHRPPLFNPNNFARNRKNLFPRIVSANLLCLPHEVAGRRITNVCTRTCGMERVL
jgi:FkbM family methyltransferase